MSEAVDRQGDAHPARERQLDVAVSLMRMALALLDRAGEPIAAARLQHAIDTAEHRRPGTPTATELERFMDAQRR